MPSTITRPNHRVTLKDIALSVGVSVNAASKVLNNTRSNAYVSQDTRRRIVEAAGALGYQPNFAARSLTRRRTDIMALYFNRALSLTEPYIAELIEGAEEACQRHGQSLLIYSRRPDETVDDICRKVLSGMADGIVVDYWTQPELIERFIQSGIPLVIYPVSYPQIPSIVFDEYAAAAKVMAYLLEQGHRSVYFRSFQTEDCDRSRAYQRAATEVGIELMSISAADGRGNLTDKEKQLLTLPRDRRPTAAVCWNDVYAYKLLDYCESVGVSVPDQLAVVGFDGVRTFPERKQLLTTVYVPWIEIAEKAVSLLVDMREGRPALSQTPVDLRLQVGDTA